MRGPVRNALRLFTRAMRPLGLRSAGKEGSGTSVVRHTGRRSGRVYETPVIAARHDDQFLIALPYGKRTDWLKNVLAEGSAVIVTDGHAYEVDRPEVIPIAEATRLLPATGSAHAPAVPRGVCPAGPPAAGRSPVAHTRMSQMSDWDGQDPRVYVVRFGTPAAAARPAPSPRGLSGAGPYPEPRGLMAIDCGSVTFAPALCW